MTDGQLTYLMQETFRVAFQLIAPLLLGALVIGVACALVQAILQMQEMTLVFVPKLLVVFLILLFLLPWMFRMLGDFTHYLLIDQWNHLFAKSTIHL